MNDYVQADWPIQKPESATGRERVIWVLGGGLAVLVYLQYFYAETLLEIISIPSIIFFVLTNGQIPPI